MQENGDFFAIVSLLQLRLPTLYNIHLLLHRADNSAIRVACDFLTKDSLVFFVQFLFATSTLQNELLVIIDQQKVGFIRIFAAWNPHGNPQKLLYSGKNGQKVAETHSEKEASSTFVVAMGLQNETSLTRFFNLRQFVSIMSSIYDNSRII